MNIKIKTPTGTTSTNSDGGNSIDYAALMQSILDNGDPTDASTVTALSQLLGARTNKMQNAGMDTNDALNTQAASWINDATSPQTNVRGNNIDYASYIEDILDNGDPTNKAQAVRLADYLKSRMRKMSDMGVSIYDDLNSEAMDWLNSAGYDVDFDDEFNLGGFASVTNPNASAPAPVTRPEDTTGAKLMQTLQSLGLQLTPEQTDAMYAAFNANGIQSPVAAPERVSGANVDYAAKLASLMDNAIDPTDEQLNRNLASNLLQRMRKQRDLGLSIDDESNRRVLEWLKNAGYTFDPGEEFDSALFNDYQVQTPTRNISHDDGKLNFSFNKLPTGGTETNPMLSRNGTIGWDSGGLGGVNTTVAGTPRNAPTYTGISDKEYQDALNQYAQGSNIWNQSRGRPSAGNPTIQQPAAQTKMRRQTPSSDEERNFVSQYKRRRPY